ncbi:uncharacterized protein LOC110863125 isoform X2 [Folsomia candida]|uniref:uncharacterized protein LOC110863125 isoform X2 n=1 Tax=Folsomia candida TaxID=158441 RepID=UPI000B90434D|nr:uncharacterized protein LOC110863125 isoform X2 [Folsomia candida]
MSRASLMWTKPIQNEFGITLDENRYFLRRHAILRKMPLMPALHSMKSRITELMAEFEVAPEGPWKVNIIDIVHQKKGSHFKFCKPVVEKSDNLNLFTPAFGFNTALKIKSEKVRPSSPVSSIYSHKRNRTPLPDVSFSANFIKGLKLERNFTNDTNEYNEPMSSRQAYNTALPSYVDIEDTNSVHSYESQEDLDGLEIPQEDFKSDFLNRIQNCLTEDMLKDAKKALQSQKGTQFSGQRDRWTTWTMQCPYVVSVLRSLFDV